MPQQGKDDPGFRKGGAFLKTNCAGVQWGLVVIKPRGVSGKADLKDSDTIGLIAGSWVGSG